MKVSPLAGKPAEASMLVNVPRLVTAYYSESPDPSVQGQRVAFGTSGHRGSPFEKALNEWHILAISHAICLYREQNKIDGPLFLGMDTHARHGIVTRSAGLLPPNHYLSVAIFYLLQHRPKWRKEAAVGKTLVSSQLIDRVTAKLGRKLYEVPVGFKWFVDGLLDGSRLVLRGPRASTGSMRRASGERIICVASWRKHGRSSAMLWRRPRSSQGFRPSQD